MTFIASFSSAASAAIDRLSTRGASGREADAGQFASVLATMTAGATRAAAGRARDLRAADEADAAHAAARKREDADADRVDTGSGAAGGAGASAASTEASRLAARDASSTGTRAEEDIDANVEEAAANEAVAREASTVPPADVRSVNRNLDSLVPELRSRLDRVMSRMEAEFGHSVTVVEAQRTQARQNFLYEQGRSRSGNVVTWTRNSNHLDGRAVDVMIDGSYNNALGYQRLAKIAAEEGLRTLGAKDPGHVELPKGIDGGGPPPQPGVTSSAFAALANDGVQGADPAGIARVADVARVADLASLARIADVARVADPTGLAMNVPADGPSSAAALLAARGAGSGASGDGSSRNGSGGHQGSDSQLASAIESELLRADPGVGRILALNGSLDAAGGLTGTDAVQRAAQILALKEGASASPLNHLLLKLENAAGGEDRIRVDLRGGSVGTTLSIGNSSEAERLASRIGELRQSLERHGLEAEAVRIRTTPVSTDRAELSRSVLAMADSESARSGSGRSGDSSQREGWKESHDQQLRRDPGDSRQRSRREQPHEDKA